MISTGKESEKHTKEQPGVYIELSEPSSSRQNNQFKPFKPIVYRNALEVIENYIGDDLDYYDISRKEMIYTLKKNTDTWTVCNICTSVISSDYGHCVDDIGHNRTDAFAWLSVKSDGVYISFGCPHSNKHITENVYAVEKT